MMRFIQIFLILILLLGAQTGFAATPTINAGEPGIKGKPQDEVRLDEQPKYRKSLYQVLCVETYKARSVQCLQSKGDGKLRAMKSGSLSRLLKRNRIFGVPFVFVRYQGGIEIVYLSNRNSEPEFYSFDLLSEPGVELARQPWWTDFWYSLDDAYWIEFEKEFISLYSGRLEPAVQKTLANLTETQVSRDGELDARYTPVRVIQDARKDRP